MPDNRSPAFPFYAADFLVDERVTRMTLEECGLHIKLLCRSWLDGSIPADVVEIARLVREPAARVKRLWRAIEPCFEPAQDGRLVQPRLERERSKQAEYRRSKSDAGKRGNAVRWSQTDRTAIAERFQDDRTATDLRLANDRFSSSSSFSRDANASLSRRAVIPVIEDVDFGDLEGDVAVFVAGAAAENKTGTITGARVKALRRSLFATLTDRLEGDRDRFAYGLRAANTAGAPNVNYVLKASRSSKPDAVASIRPAEAQNDSDKLPRFGIDLRLEDEDKADLIAR
jgi:uncharacterized protein YdaU (DUF1376 family)